MLFLASPLSLLVDSHYPGDGGRRFLRLQVREEAEQQPGVQHDDGKNQQIGSVCLHQMHIVEENP